MNIRKLGILGLTLAAGVCSLSSDSQAARRAMPSDGAPFPPSNPCFTYLNGQVLNNCPHGDGVQKWDLTAHMDNTQFNMKSMTIHTNGNSVIGTKCYGVAVTLNGGAVIGSPVTGQLSQYPNTPNPITTPNVNVDPNGFFMVTCELPGDHVGRRARIASYRYTP